MGWSWSVRVAQAFHACIFEERFRSNGWMLDKYPAVSLDAGAPGRLPHMQVIAVMSYDAEEAWADAKTMVDELAAHGIRSGLDPADGDVHELLGSQIDGKRPHPHKF